VRTTASSHIVRTTASSHNLALASSVSRTCGSSESSSLVTQAIPPCAQAAFVSASLLFVVTGAEPRSAVFNAKLRPAMPLPDYDEVDFAPNDVARCEIEVARHPV
jgi:hypothetical protein